MGPGEARVSQHVYFVVIRLRIQIMISEKSDSFSVILFAWNVPPSFWAQPAGWMSPGSKFGPFKSVICRSIGLCSYSETQQLSISAKNTLKTACIQALDVWATRKHNKAESAKMIRNVVYVVKRNGVKSDVLIQEENRDMSVENVQEGPWKFAITQKPKQQVEMLKEKEGTSFSTDVM